MAIVWANIAHIASTTTYYLVDIIRTIVFDLLCKFSPNFVYGQIIIFIFIILSK